MGKKGYNWKGRQVVNTVIDNTDTKKIKLDLHTEGSYDQSNELVLPSKKRNTKVKEQKKQVTKILSKKQRKRLEKVVEKKKKKENRASLLEALSEVQATPEELDQLTSIATIQTKGLKKYFQEQQASVKTKQFNSIDSQISEVKINILAGAKRRRDAITNKDKNKINDPNIIGFESSGSDTDSDEDEGEDTEKESMKKIKLDEEEMSEDDIENVKEEIDEVQGTNQGDKVESIKEVNRQNTLDCINIDKSENEKDTNKQSDQKTEEEIKKVSLREKKPAVFIPVNRKASIQKARLKLPILAEEQQIMEMINENSVVILAGETGSGKTTQVPQFLYEAGYVIKRMIAITEPRRVAAQTMSKRVAEEMNLTSKEVSYLIRFEGNVTDDTKIKFMTDGVLLKEIESDFLLTKYSVVILDEAHERSVYTDILIGLLSRIAPLRNKRGDPLKLIIMSATLRLRDFTENPRLFKITPPVIKVEGRQFPVTVHFNRKTNKEYLREAYNKTVKIHTQLPEGGILIFVSGQKEVNLLVRKLRKKFPLKHKNKQINENEDDLGSEKSDVELEDELKHTLKSKKKAKTVPKVNLDDYGIFEENGDGDDINSEGELNIESENEDLADVDIVLNNKPLWVLPLFSLLPSYKQAEVFKPPPEGCRLCVVSTNVAETSLTIPNIKYVVDTGKTKMKLYDKLTGAVSYVVTWTSKASADQRSGRAGRLGPGHCYRIYSSAVYDNMFQEFSVPEIQLKPVDDLFLQMKYMHIDKVINFPFPTAPDLMQLQTAEKRLETLGAIKNGKITPLGRAIARFPVLPRFGKMLALSHQQNLLPYTICIVAALSVQEVLLETPILQTNEEQTKLTRQKWAATRRQYAGVGNFLLLGDVMVLLQAVGSAEFANSQGKLEPFCLENGLRHKAIVEIRKLRIQLTSDINMNIPDCPEILVDPKLKPPTDIQAKLLRQIILSGMGDQVAKKVMPEELKEDENKTKFKYAYQANNMEERVFLHQGSVLKKTLPEFVVYQELYETHNKMYIRGITAIEPEWLPLFVPHLCQLSAPLKDPEPRYDSKRDLILCTVTGTFGSQAWPLPNVEIEYPKTIDAYKWFARFLLEGQLFQKLEKYKDSLLSQPSVMVKTWARLQPRTDSLLKALIAKEILTKKALENAWKENPKYLLTEYLKWLPESAYGEIALFWPPL